MAEGEGRERSKEEERRERRGRGGGKDGRRGSRGGGRRPIAFIHLDTVQRCVHNPRNITPAG